MPSLNCVVLSVAKVIELELVWTVKFGAAIEVTLPWMSSISPLSSSSLLPAATEVVTLNLGITLADVGGVPVKVTEPARSRSKLITADELAAMVIAGLNVTLTVVDVSVAGIFTGAGGTALFR